MKFLLAFCIGLLCANTAAAGGTTYGSDDPTPASLRAALLSAPVPAALTADQGRGGRSIPLAFAASAVVPGVGQAYNRQWIKAAAAVALEAAFLYATIHYRQRGRDEEDAYQAYAHAHWSPAQYAQWLNDYAEYLGVDAPPVDVDAFDVDFGRPGTWSAADRQRARQLFDQIHAVETRVYHPETGASFSHQLPYFGEQQYYELIGKYFQFAPGWTDYPEWRATGDGEFTEAIDPEQTGPGGTKPNVSERFWDYDDLTEHANDLLRSASRASAFLLLNHLVSAIDAAVFAKLHNQRVQTQVAVQHDAWGRPQTTATLALRF